MGHNSLAVLGLACIGLVLFFSSDSALRLQVERQAFEWLNLRHGVAPTDAEAPDLLAELAEPGAVARATARDPSALPKEQALVVNWLSRRYRVAPEPVASLVQEAWVVGKKAKLEPTLLLAIMAIESSFNPFAQSSVGAQGLMQVMTRVHDEKYTAFGGKLAAFDPLANLRVGAQILNEYLSRAGGDVALALKYYVGAANLPDDGGYADRVLAEQGFLRAVAAGQSVSLAVSNNRGSSTSSASAAQATAPKVAQSKVASSADDLAPALHTVPGTVMAPAVGAALAANLSPAPAAAAPVNNPATAAERNAVAKPTAAANGGSPAAAGSRAVASTALPPQPAAAASANGVPLARPTGGGGAAPASAAPQRVAPSPTKPRIETAPVDGRVALADDPVR